MGELQVLFAKGLRALLDEFLQLHGVALDRIHRRRHAAGEDGREAEQEASVAGADQERGLVDLDADQHVAQARREPQAEHREEQTRVFADLAAVTPEGLQQVHEERGDAEQETEYRQREGAGHVFESEPVGTVVDRALREDEPGQEAEHDRAAREAIGVALGSALLQVQQMGRETHEAGDERPGRQQHGSLAELRGRKVLRLVEQGDGSAHACDADGGDREMQVRGLVAAQAVQPGVEGRGAKRHGRKCQRERRGRAHAGSIGRA